jgi:hypothetical protein
MESIFSSIIGRATQAILLAFHYIFPEYPKIGLILCLGSLALFVYYFLRGKFVPAVKMSLSTLLAFTVLLYAIHWLIKLFRLVV